MKYFSASSVVAVLVFGLLFLVPNLPLGQLGIPSNLITELLILTILALGLNVIIGYTGLLHLGIAGVYGIGTVCTGILVTEAFPFQQSFVVTLIISTVVTALISMAITAPVLRLRGDYFALVTLGFCEIVVTVLKEFEHITGGKKTLQNLRPPLFPEFLSSLEQSLDLVGKWRIFPIFYYICLGLLLLIFLGLRNLEKSRIGRGFVAIREDELAASAMGLNPAKLKLMAIGIGSGIVGLAGCLFAVHSTNTTEPQVSFTFNVSVIILASVILGGMGNRTGMLVGVLLLLGYDKIGTRLLSDVLSQLPDKPYFKLSSWRYMIFGLVLILMMRFRPYGIIPEKRN